MELSVIERRRYPRFDTKLRVRSFDFSFAREMEGSTCDVSSMGIGCTSNRDMPSGSILDIWLYMPDNEVALHTTGKVVWSVRSTEGHRLGIRLDREEIKPIPLVLKSIQMRSRYYY